MIYKNVILIGSDMDDTCVFVCSVCVYVCVCSVVWCIAK